MEKKRCLPLSIPVAAVLMLGLCGIEPSAALAGDLIVDNINVYNDSTVYGNLTVIHGDAPTNPRLHYSFDTNESGIVTDLSGYCNTGTVSGATWGSTGCLNGAFTFDGSDDYIQAPDSSSLDIQGPLTISAWAKINVPGGMQGLVMKDDEGSDRGYWLAIDGGYLHFQISSDGTGYQIYDVVSDQPYSLSTWTHIVAEWNGTLSAGVKFYINGEAQATRPSSPSFSGTTIFNSSQPLRIGGKSSGGWPFSGDIDEVRLYDRALLVTEVQQLYSNTLSYSFSTGVVLRVDDTEVTISRLKKQGDIGMGTFTNEP